MWYCHTDRALFTFIWYYIYVMQIHMFIAHMGLGGAERVCVTLANEWAKRGYEVHIAVLNLDGDINTQNLEKSVQVHELGVSRLRYSMIPMLMYIRRHNPRFMFIFGSEMAVILSKLKKLHLINTPLIVRVLNNVNISLAKEDNVSPVVEKYLNHAQSLLREMDHVIAQCNAMGAQLLEKGIVAEDKLSIIYNPVSELLLEKVHATETTASEAYDTDEQVDITKKREVTFIGRIDPQKNPIDLIKSFKIVHERESDVVLRMVGVGSLESVVKEEVANCGLNDAVVFDGIRTDMENVYASSSVVVLSSDYEGMPNCLIEAIGAGVPIVSYDCPMGPAEIVVDDVNGYLVPMGDVQMLAEKIVLSLNRKWDRQAIINTCDKFRVRNIADRYDELFRGL